MPDPLMGRYASIKIGATLVENLGRWNLSLSIDEIDASAFGTVWKKMMPGFQGWSATLEGNYDPADTDGQALLQAAALSATKLTDLRLFVDSTSYWVPDLTDNSAWGCYIGGLDIVHDKAGIATVTFSVLGYGKLNLV